MYKFTKLPMKEEATVHHISDGIHTGLLEDIENTLSRGGDQMFKLKWKIGEHHIYDYLLPEHPNKVCREIAHNKMSTMAELMLGAPDNEEVDLMDCLYKEAYLMIKSKPGHDGNLYPRIVAIKKPPTERISIKGKIPLSTIPKESSSTDYINDECPF